MNLRPSSRADLEIGAPIWIRDRLEALSHFSIHWLICTTVAGGKPLKYVEDAWL
jgi:hypothetical protein